MENVTLAWWSVEECLRTINQRLCTVTVTLGVVDEDVDEDEEEEEDWRRGSLSRGCESIPPYKNRTN